MAREYREPPRRAIDPLMEICIEGVAAGYRGVEYVTEGLSESLRRRPGSGFEASGRRARRARSGRGRGRATVVGDIADLTAELLDRLGEAAREAAGHIEEFDGAAHCPTLELCGLPGDEDAVEFRLTNTSPAALTEVRFCSTDLIGGGNRIDADRIGFEYPDDDRIARIRSGGSTIVIVGIEIPEDAEPGIYRGVIATRSETPAGRGQLDREARGGWALIELDVAHAKRPRAE